MGEYGGLRAWLLVAMLDKKLKPREVAEMLEQMPIHDPRLAQEVAAEALRYRAMGDVWL